MTPFVGLRRSCLHRYLVTGGPFQGWSRREKRNGGEGGENGARRDAETTRAFAVLSIVRKRKGRTTWRSGLGKEKGLGVTVWGENKVHDESLR